MLATFQLMLNHKRHWLKFFSFSIQLHQNVIFHFYWIFPSPPNSKPEARGYNAREKLWQAQSKPDTVPKKMTEHAS